MELDPLSAVFAPAMALVTMLAAIYGSEYLQSHAGRKNLGVSWFFFNLLTVSMLLVVAARNGVLFLVAWELMSLASFFLVMMEDETESVRRAGWIYLVAMHLGTAFLLALFLLLGHNAESLDFEYLTTAAAPSGVLFVLAVIGFGTKAGFIPMHVWLPETHPAAPSHVSAVMSGVMIKTGIYGLLRMLTLIGPPAAWWGWTFVAIGVVSGIFGVLYALSQHDLKRLLAYHSVENIGIIALGIGVGVLGVSYQQPGDGGPRIYRRPASRRQPRRIQEPAVPRRRIGVARHGHRRTRSFGWTSQAYAGDRHDVSDRRRGNFGAASAEWLRERVPHLPRRRRGPRKPAA